MRWRGVETYEASFDAMRAFTDTRTADTGDEIWLVEHPPVYALGRRPAGGRQRRAAREGRPRRANHYHGPGQIVAYLLLDLRRRKLMVRTLVTKIEEAVIETLAAYNLASVRKAARPDLRGVRRTKARKSRPSA